MFGLFIGYCGVACGHHQDFLYTQDVNSTLAGEKADLATGHGRNPQHFPTCAQDRCLFAQVIHKLVHRRSVSGPRSGRGSRGPACHRRRGRPPAAGTDRFIHDSCAGYAARTMFFPSTTAARPLCPVLRDRAMRPRSPASTQAAARPAVQGRRRALRAGVVRTLGTALPDSGGTL